MKLEIRNNTHDNGKLIKSNPVMGVLIGPCPKWGLAVLKVVVGKTVDEVKKLTNCDVIVDKRNAL